VKYRVEMLSLHTRLISRNATDYLVGGGANQEIHTPNGPIYDAPMITSSEEVRSCFLSCFVADDLEQGHGKAERHVKSAQLRIGCQTPMPFRVHRDRTEAVTKIIRDKRNLLRDTTVDAWNNRQTGTKYYGLNENTDGFSDVKQTVKKFFDSVH